MKAKRYLSKKTVSYLKDWDLSKFVEDLDTIHSNIQEDVPYYLMRLDTTECGSLNLHALKALGGNIYSAGARFNCKSVNSDYRKSYVEFVEKNAYDISRELACCSLRIKSTELGVGKDDAFAQPKALRKIIHKAWVHAKWEGLDCGDELMPFIREGLPEFKKKTAVQIQKENGKVYNQFGSNVWIEPNKPLLTRSYYYPQTVHYERLHILGIGLGQFTFNEDTAPIFSYRKYPGELYIAAQNDRGEKHLIRFHDFNALSLCDKLKVDEWRLSRICATSGGAFRYLLKGDADGTTVIECFGVVPFYTPVVVRG